MEATGTNYEEPSNRGRGALSYKKWSLCKGKEEKWKQRTRGSRAKTYEGGSTAKTAVSDEKTIKIVLGAEHSARG